MGMQRTPFLMSRPLNRGATVAPAVEIGTASGMAQCNAARAPLAAEACKLLDSR